MKKESAVVVKANDAFSLPRHSAGSLARPSGNSLLVTACSCWVNGHVVGRNNLSFTLLVFHGLAKDEALFAKSVKLSNQRFAVPIYLQYDLAYELSWGKELFKTVGRYIPTALQLLRIT